MTTILTITRIIKTNNRTFLHQIILILITIIDLVICLLLVGLHRSSRTSMVTTITMLVEVAIALKRDLIPEEECIIIVVVTIPAAVDLLHTITKITTTIMNIIVKAMRKVKAAIKIIITIVVRDSTTTLVVAVFITMVAIIMITIMVISIASMVVAIINRGSHPSTMNRVARCKCSSHHLDTHPGRAISVLVVAMQSVALPNLTTAHDNNNNNSNNLVSRHNKFQIQKMR